MLILISFHDCGLPKYRYQNKIAFYAECVSCFTDIDFMLIVLKIQVSHTLHMIQENEVNQIRNTCTS